MNGVLLRAIERKQPIQLIYLDDQQQITQRKVLPYEVKDHYLKAHCFLRKQFRLFKLENILSAFPVKQENYPKSS